METIVSMLIAMTIAGPLVIAASVTGQQERLCAALGGKFEPKPAPGEVCPGGEWSNLVGLLKERQRGN